MPEPGPERCSTASRLRSEALLASASRVQRWLLVEQPGPWGREVPRDSRMDPGVARSLDAHARANRVRVVLIRRPGWETVGARRAFLVRSSATTRWVGELEVGADEQLLDVDLAAAFTATPPPGAVSAPAALRLVCTNGKHDACCADRGRPVVRALRDGGVAGVWECSHVGGDRFAANVVFLPSGIYYGRVEPGEAVSLVRALEDHELLDLAHYRGRSWMNPLAQACEVFARSELGERRLAALEVDSPRPTGDVMTSTVRRGDDRFEVTVARQRVEPQRLTCTAEKASAAWGYRLVSFRTLPAG